MTQVLPSVSGATSYFQLQILATPAGLEPATNSLEGCGASSEFKACSDKFSFRAPIEIMSKNPSCQKIARNRLGVVAVKPLRLRGS
jgi:hypothetical protein